MRQAELELEWTFRNRGANYQRKYRLKNTHGKVLKQFVSTNRHRFYNEHQSSLPLAPPSQDPAQQGPPSQGHTGGTNPTQGLPSHSNT